jgi:hypothetical protein
MRTRLGFLRRFIAALVVLPVVFDGRSAFAEPAPTGFTPPAAPIRREPTPGDFATARAALKEGLALREKGDLHGALARLATAYDLVPTPVTGFELGKTHMLLGHVLQAHELFEKVVRMPPSMEESTRSQTSRDEAARLSQELEPRIPSLRLSLSLPNGGTAVVRIDDDAVAVPAGGVERAVEPGPHDIVARAGDGPEEKVHVDLAEGETKDVALAPKWVQPKVAAPKGEQVILVRQTNPLAFVGFGTAAVALVVTLVSGYVYLGARDEVKSRCGANYCPPVPKSVFSSGKTTVDTTFDSEKTRYQVSGWLTIAGMVTTSVFLGIGIFGAARPLKERVVARPTITPSVGLGHLGLSGTF